jgi:PAS domain S-box-containing protein
LSGGAALVFLGLLAGDLLPEFYRSGAGFTVFRNGVTAALLALAVVVFMALVRRRRTFDPTVFKNLMVAISSAGVAELLFLLQRQPFDPLAAAAIFLKIPAYLALYNAILVTGMVRPYDMLFHRLARHAQKLRQEKDLAQLYFDTAAVMMIVMDAGERIVSVNRRSCDILGYAAEDMIGKNWFDLLLPQSFKEEARSRYRRYLTRSHDRLTSFESPVVTRTGDERLIAWHSRLLKDAGSAENPMVLRSGEDITERRRMERDLERLVEEKTRELETTLKELQDARRLSDIGTLAASVAHELRNPLGVIRTAAYNMRRKGVNPALHRNLDNIDKKVLEGSHIINNLLNYARLKMPQYERVNIIDVLNDCLETVNSRFITHAVKVEVNTIGMDAGLRIDADPHQLGEVLTNVLTNAFQAFPDKTGRVDVSISNANEWLDITIRDYGTGIPAEALPRIYEPFFTTKSKGTGLGLTICSEVLHLHGGGLEIESRQGDGTSVHVRLPLRRRQGNGQEYSVDR